MTIWSYFTDPVLRAPTLGCMLMCLAASLMGVLAFLKKRSLLGESLSHAAYPGVVIGMGFYAVSGIYSEAASLLFALGGALLFSILGLRAIDWLERKGKVKSDAALCFMLASFFGVGILAASWLQGAHPALARQVQLYLYGQAATMTDLHIVIYGVLASIVTLFLFVAYRPLQASLFDRDFAASAGVTPRYLTFVTFTLLLLSIVIGIRSVGVILMSGMLIAPAVAARQFTDRLSLLLCLAGLFGLISGFFGNYLSVEGSISLSASYPEMRLSLPTGPMIVLVGTAIALLSLLFAPKRGIAARVLRIARFRLRCVEENILKSVWKKGTLPYFSLRQDHHLGRFSLSWILRRMKNHGWMSSRRGDFFLTPDGMKKAARIVRLHRLWEAYLADLGWPGERVHRTAEEMEHILTPELEERLTHQLRDPKLDPHEQPIPERHH